jgi:hypothetical protein
LDYDSAALTVVLLDDVKAVLKAISMAEMLDALLAESTEEALADCLVPMLVELKVDLLEHRSVNSLVDSSVGTWGQHLVASSAIPTVELLVAM